jgi:hypothetical protein
MPRLIEIVLFVAPFAGFIAWRLLFPSPHPPLWLLSALAVFVVVMLSALLWLRHIDAGDAGVAYVPAQLQDGRVLKAHPARPP